MSSGRSILLVKTAAGEGEAEGGVGGASALNMVPLGSYGDVVRALGEFNTAPDGSAEGRGVLYGPGITVQMPMLSEEDPVGQLLVSLVDDEIAWPVLIRVCRALGWRMMDPNSGRTFG